MKFIYTLSRRYKVTGPVTTCLEVNVCFFFNFRKIKWLVKFPLLMFFLQKAGWFKWGWQDAEEDYQTPAQLLKEPTERQSFIWTLQSGNQTESGSSACPVPLCATICNSWGILVATSFWSWKSWSSEKVDLSLFVIKAKIQN